MSGVFKLNHMQPFKPILILLFSICLTFIYKLLPIQRANNEKGEFSQLQKWMGQRGIGVCGFQTGPCVAL